jgi:cholesterol oxidase
MIQDAWLVPDPASLPVDADGFHADVLVIGSGFGGSVSALRLTEKGYKVLVIERGKRWLPGDFPKTNWNVRKSMWAPALGWFGILRLSLLDDVMVLSGAGVGGGSLVYANTLLIPPAPFFKDPQWAGMVEDWHAELAGHYKTAQKMLGAVANPVFGPADAVLREVAEEMGRGATSVCSLARPQRRSLIPILAAKAPIALAVSNAARA